MSVATGKVVLENGTLRWSSPGIFNDIDECQFSPFSDEDFKLAFNAYSKVVEDCARGRLFYNYNGFSGTTRMTISAINLGLKNEKYSDADLEIISSDLLNNVFSNPEDYFRDYVNNAIINCTRVLCLTSDYNNDLMWAHYANEHKGCVFEFKQPYKKKPQKFREGPVNYIEDLDSSVNGLDLLLYGETPQFNDALIREVFFSKKKHWSYEEEYRLMFSESFGVITNTLDFQNKTRELEVNGQSSDLYTDVSYDPQALISVTFGVRTTPQDIDDIITLTLSKNPTCQFYKMHREKGKTVRKLIDT